jgi:guanosine-3',5'-bis(diphosphate) 3'-pyrophosphohydrolase
MIRHAIEFATDKHEGQVRKGNGESYINHPGRVANRLMIVDPYIDEAVVAAAWLHDTLEDTDTTDKDRAIAI